MVCMESRGSKMMKKIVLITFVLISMFVGCLMLVIYFFNDKQVDRNPILELTTDNVQVEYDREFQYLDYVATAKDRDGNDLLDDHHITIDSDLCGRKGDYEVTYVLIDDDFNKTQKTLLLTVEKDNETPIKYSTKDNTQGNGSIKSIKEDKVFYLKDYNNEVLVTRSKADWYGYNSSQIYSVQEEKDENGELIGYRCVFQKEEGRVN